MKEHEFFETQTLFPFHWPDAVISATYLYALFENSPIAIIALDAEHRYMLCNPAFEKLFQYTPGELASINLDRLIAAPEAVEEATRLSDQVLRGIKVHTVAQRRRRDGMMVDVEIYGIPMTVKGILVGVYELYQDVTDRNRAQNAYREISDQFENLQRQERARLARDLHDSTSQELAVLNWNLARLVQLAGDRDDTLRELVSETKEIAYQCSSRVRRASYLLHPPLLGEGGLNTAVPWLAEEFEHRSGIAVTLKMSQDLGRFREEIEIAFFRIVQEGLANVLRHSGSPVVRISLNSQQGWLELTIGDQGRRHVREALLQARDRRSGIGISGMRERVEQLGGCFQISCTAEGTTLIATVPADVVLNA